MSLRGGDSRRGNLLFAGSLRLLRHCQGSQRHTKNIMLDFILIALVGWPAIIVTVILAIIGLLKRDYRFLVGAATMAFPFSWYLSGFPDIRSPAFLLPVLLFASGFAMNRGREMIAWLLAIPFFLSIILLFFVILAGNGNR